MWVAGFEEEIAELFNEGIEDRTYNRFHEWASEKVLKEREYHRGWYGINRLRVKRWEKARYWAEKTQRNIRHEIIEHNRQQRELIRQTKSQNYG